QSTAAAIFWIVTTFSVIFSVTRSMRVEFENKALEGQLVYGASAVAIYVGKVVGQSLILFAADLVVAGITFVLYGVSPGNFVLLVLATLLATMGLSAIGLLYGALIGESRGGEGLLPLLLLPIALPILVAATKTWQDSLGRHGSINDPWLKVIALFSLVFLAVGAVLFGVLLED
ncbi:MAG: heme exporter protein CcmB, partial [Actinomycetota bacterium]|nr:heme exporter protein CcmB [Actinomycetota bacterium]